MSSKIVAKYKNLPIEARAVLWFTFCTMFQKGILFITSPIFTKIMPKEQFGRYSIYISWLSILSLVLTLNLHAGVFNNAMHKYKQLRDKYISSMQGLSIVVLLLFFIIFLLFKDFWCDFLFLSSPYIIYMMFVYFLFLPGYNFWICRNRFEYKYASMVIVTVAVSVLSLLGSVFMSLYAKNNAKADAAIIAYIAVYSFFGLVLTCVNIKKGKMLYNRSFWKYALFFNIPLIPHYLSTAILGQADRIMIGRYCGEAEAGIYSLVYNISQGLSVIIISINHAVTPWQYKKMDSRDIKSISDIWNIILTIIGIILLLVVLLAPEIIRICATKDYVEAKWVIVPIILGIYFTSVYYMFASYEFYFEANKFIAVASVGGALLNIVLNSIFIPKFGYTAAAYTTLFCYGIFTMTHTVFACYVIKKKWNMNVTSYMKKTLFIILIIFVLSSVVMFSYKYDLLRFVLIVLFIICVLSFIHKSKNKINKIINLNRPF